MHLVQVVLDKLPRLVGLELGQGILHTTVAELVDVFIHLIPCVFPQSRDLECMHMIRAPKPGEQGTSETYMPACSLDLSSVRGQDPGRPKGTPRLSFKIPRRSNAK